MSCNIGEVTEMLQNEQRKSEIFITASKDIDLEVNSENTKQMIIYGHRNVIQNQNIVIGNLPFENVENFKYLGATVRNANHIHEEIKHRINLGIAYQHSLDKIFFVPPVSKKMKINAYKTIVLYGCEIQSLILREKHKLS